jgi:lipopolysaccharide transport system permease protein
MIVFTFVFSKIAKLPSEGNTPYAIMVFAGLLPWQFFSNAITESSNSIVGNSNLISKVYFPRIIIPTSSFITSLIDFLISFVILICLMFYYHYTPSLRIMLIPVLILLAFFAAYGVGLWLTTMNVKYRDFRYIVPFIVQFGLYISPVGFSSSMVPQKYRILYSLNPMTGVIDAFRWSILGNSKDFYLPGFITSLFVIIVSFFYSIYHFRKMEKAFADYI